ncbi:MAG: glycosyltransferase family 4 protein [Paludibacteraceae bacterium]|nr:glycosyltransferase family 4 protein [Paludibacteraceae bacterium]
MNILFLTISHITDLNASGIYTDLMREFRDKGHKVYIVSPIERKYKSPTFSKKENGITLLKVKTFNLQKTNFIEKGIGTLAIEYQFHSSIKKYFPDIYFDLVLYSTPPITFTKVVRYIKKQYHAKSYLLLKDIFPQNAVDIGLLKKNGLLHRFFSRKEKKLYEASDYIGCMSPANVKFILKHNKSISPSKVEVCPNSIKMKIANTLSDDEKKKIKKEHNIPPEATLFIYGGNLGKPQGLDFLLRVLESNNSKTDRFFLIVGSGTEFTKIKNWFNVNQPSNALLLSELPKEEYDKVVQTGDVGLIFLDPRFTIPNYPSRLLSYLEHKIPVLMATDTNTDIGKIAEQNGYGFWTENGNLEEFNSLLDKFCSDKKLITQMGEKGYAFLKNNYTVEKSYQVIMNHFENVI